MSSTAVIVGVLIASAAIASVLAFQAISAARSREAVSQAMLRQYAQLAAWEFSREVRKDVEMSLSHTLRSLAHPAGQACDCGTLPAGQPMFEVNELGVVPRSGTMPPELIQAIAQLVPFDRAGSMEGAMRLRRLDGPGTRFVAHRWEPHVGQRGGQVGVIVDAAALRPLFARTSARASMLPVVLAGNRHPRDLVDLQIVDAHGATVFRSANTTPGPQIVRAALFGEDAPGLQIAASMTPAFVATLGPEHGGGPNGTLIVGLVIVNILMVAIGLWQLARERELSRLRTDFVAGVSHELRTPLAQIRMFTDTLLLERVRNPVEGRRALEIISRETRRLSQLVENVLYFHRHERVPAAPPSEPLDLAALVAEVAEGFKPLAASRRVGIAIHRPVGGVIVLANADGLRQVLLNLLDNAVKFGPADETVTVSLDAAGDVARIAVEDRGSGVPAADRQRIFERFERGGTHAHAGGAGIGLAVVRQIVRAHRGSVTVEEAAAGGARFVVSLPLADEDLRDPAAVSLAG